MMTAQEKNTTAGNGNLFIGWDAPYFKAESSRHAVAEALMVRPEKVVGEFSGTYSVDGVWYDVNNRSGATGIEYQVVRAY